MCRADRSIDGAEGNKFRAPGPAVRAALFCACALAVAGCGIDMADQPRYEPLEASGFFADGRASRPLVPGTVARGHLRTDRHYFTGRIDGRPSENLPAQILEDWDLRDLLARGRERFDIFCSVCHDRTGTGRGMVVQRGYPQPPQLHIERLREAPIGLFFDVITNGFGRMPEHADQIPAEDRWAIAAYIRALQFSRHAMLEDLAPRDREQLMNTDESRP